MKSLIVFLLIFISNWGYSQSSLNDYKYVVVNNQYEFQKEPNEYRLNEMIVFEIEKRGLKAFRHNSVLPADLNKGACNSLTLKVDYSSGLRVKMTFDFINCSDEVVYSTKQGIGRTKDFEKAYREAVRDAMTSLDEVNYSYEKPQYIKTIQGAISDSIRVRPRKPGDKIIIKEELETEKPEDTNENVSDITVSEKVKVVDDKIYDFISGKFKMQSTDTGFNIYKNNNLIGTLKKSQSGCYLAVTTDFIGIGYEKDNNVVIEYDKDGTQFLILEKVK